MGNWVLYGILSALFFAGMALTIKKVLTLNLNPIVLNLFLFGFTFIWFMIWTIFQGKDLTLSKEIFLFLILASVFALFGNYFDVKALQAAPNPGYASALKASQIILITLLAPILLSSSFNLQKFVGVIVVFIGVFLLSL